MKLPWKYILGMYEEYDIQKKDQLNSLTVLEIMRCCDFGTKTRSDINVI